MDHNFYNYLFEKTHSDINIPTNEVIAAWAEQVMNLLFIENTNKKFESVAALKAHVFELEQELSKIISASCKLKGGACHQSAARFFEQLSELYRILDTDINAIYEGDPAARSRFEVIRTYPGFYAICLYRIAHLLFNLDIPLVPRILTEHAHSKTGIDIHPAAEIGEYFYIDHGTGIVVGETTVIGKYVKLYQGVTLGALSVKKTLAGSKRHPTVEDRVVIYSGATILGGETVIGHDSIIGGNVWLTESLAPFSTAYHSPTITIRNIKETN
ncbi:serine acetyltransferase [Pedobacter chinensis]|uniref:Serine acetyltransferase n=1 Tax=Pedobacter chinensis TaxID=2282421 RepID=A0A369Q3B6_9SPHI|nr:serine O-acetyltransferase EpsC [Pedobacter chinensis]RDC57955.1 serine acetyltransferase [Pedobacter chinensis]